MNRYAFTSPYVPFAWEINRGSADLMGERGNGVSLDPVLKNNLGSIYENTYSRDRFSKGDFGFFDDEAHLWDRVSAGEMQKDAQTDNKKDDITDEILNKRDIIAANELFSEKTANEISSVGILYELLINVCRAKKEPLSREIYLNITM